ncbi:biotin/lipoyl-binding protein, partial [uncultured Campylobacter sp.]|uniref:biotin/lipoyl-binding protein n=1 Tax=uncultured Campylobacter sp. TaxID=218934 RepID=UPI00261C8A84
MLKIFKRIDDDSNEFKPLLIEIEDAPQNPLGRSILWIACGALIFAVLWMVFAKVDIVVSANGKVVPDGEIKILKSLESGVVSKILVKEGDRVKKGDHLILIDPSVSTVNLSTKQESLALLEYSIKRLDALSSGKSLDANISADELSLYNTQKSNYEESINVYNLKMQALQMGINSTNLEVERLSGILKIDEARLNNLNKVKDIIARKDLYELKSKVIELNSNLKISKEKLAEQRANLDELAKELEAFKSQSISKWLDEMLAKQKEASSLKAEINAILFQTRQQIISSPVDGFVGKLLVNTQGTAITNQENLISIVPSDKPLIIKANVLN